MHFSQSCRPVSQNEDSSRSGVWGRWLFPSNDTSLLLPLPGRRGQRRTNAVSSSGSGEKEPTGRKLILLKKPEPLWLSHFPRGCTSYHHHHHKDKSLQGLQRDTNMQNMQKKIAAYQEKNVSWMLRSLLVMWFLFQPHCFQFVDQLA